MLSNGPTLCSVQPFTWWPQLLFSSIRGSTSSKHASAMRERYLTTQISFEGKVCKLFASMIDSLNSSLSRCLSKCWLHADKYDHTQSNTCESGFQWSLFVSETASEPGNKSKGKTALWNKTHEADTFCFDQLNGVLKSQIQLCSFLQIALQCMTDKVHFNPLKTVYDLLQALKPESFPDLL